jgi:hypothetical protein
MKHFQSIEKLDTAILYILELAASLSIILLAFGLIASMANVLTKGSVLTHNEVMQEVWAWTQCIAIDASVAGTIIRTIRAYNEREYIKAGVYTLLSALLLFTAAIVSNIEAVQQTLNITLDSAYTHVFIPLEALIWVRSIAIVLLIVAHALKHINISLPVRADNTAFAPTQPSVTVVENHASQQALPPPQPLQQTTTTDNGERVRLYLVDKPDATVRDVASALSISHTTANKWMKRIKSEVQA